MIDCTDQYFRQLVRLISRHAYLYTEMITAQAILRGDHARLLAYDPMEQPVAIQLGGSDPKLLAEAAQIAEMYGYIEINLNVGCPSDRVQAGRFGACLMKEPALVAECVGAMREVVSVPVTVKSRIGVDDMDSYTAFANFVAHVSKAPCNTFIVHARKAWLKGLSPKQNRTIPPLKYEFVHQLKKDFPELELIINGGINDLDNAGDFEHLDGIMVGREAYKNPYHLSVVDASFYGATKAPLSRRAVLEAYLPYAERALAQGLPFTVLMKHCCGLAHGLPGGAQWRRLWGEYASAQPTLAGLDALLKAFPAET